MLNIEVTPIGMFSDYTEESVFHKLLTTDEIVEFSKQVGKKFLSDPSILTSDFDLFGHRFIAFDRSGCCRTKDVLACLKEQLHNAKLFREEAFNNASNVTVMSPEPMVVRVIDNNRDQSLIQDIYGSFRIINASATVGMHAMLSSINGVLFLDYKEVCQSFARECIKEVNVHERRATSVAGDVYNISNFVDPIELRNSRSGVYYVSNGQVVHYTSK